jgi:hypothetical protein
VTTVREVRVHAARGAISLAFNDTPFGAWDDKINSDTRIPPGMNMAPYFDRMAEYVVDALFPPDPLIDQAKVPGSLRSSEGPEIDG